jgi:nucleoside-diphosphate-sugar epimerase
MSYRVFLAGASGAIGSRLTPLLRAAGHHVAGTTRSAAKATRLHALGATPVVVDVLDADALTQAVVSFRPDVVIHQLTDLPRGLKSGDMEAAIARNARIREMGTGNLVKAALAAGANRIVAQSIAWAYAPGPTPHSESDPLDLSADGTRGVTVGGVAALERSVLRETSIDGVVLRYGKLYGPGTGVDQPPESLPLHVDAAAHAALLAVDSPVSGVFNIVEPNPDVATEAARTQLHWRADYRLPPALLHGRRSGEAHES